MVDRRKALALFPPGANIKDSHNRESPTGHEQDLMQKLLNEVVQQS